MNSLSEFVITCLTRRATSASIASRFSFVFLFRPIELKRQETMSRVAKIMHWTRGAEQCAWARRHFSYSVTYSSSRDLHHHVGNALVAGYLVWFFCMMKIVMKLLLHLRRLVYINKSSIAPIVAFTFEYAKGTLHTTKHRVNKYRVPISISC